MRIAMTLAFVSLTGLALVAQGQQPSSTKSSPDAQQKVTVTGCLAAGPNNTFTLTSPAPANQSTTSAGTTGTTGTTAGSTGSTAGKNAVKTITYTLTAGSNVDLKGQVGRKVQVSGTATPPQASASETEGSAAVEQPKGTSGRTPVVKTTEQAHIVARQMTVSSVKTVAANCDILK